MKTTNKKSQQNNPEPDGEISGSAASVWDQAASGYDQVRQNDPVYLSCLQLVTRPLCRARVGLCLDAGCGTGLSTVEALRHCGRVVAVDYSRESLSALHRKGFGDQVWAVQADLTRLPFKDGAFDAAICANALQHLRPGMPQRQAVAELDRVITARGLLAVSVHHFSHAKRRAGWIKEGRPGEPGIDYIFRFTRRELSSLLPGTVIRSAGFYALARLPWLGRRLQNATAALFGRLAARFRLGHMLVGVRPGSGTRKRRRTARPVSDLSRGEMARDLSV